MFVNHLSPLELFRQIEMIEQIIFIIHRLIINLPVNLSYYNVYSSNKKFLNKLYKIDNKNKLRQIGNYYKQRLEIFLSVEETGLVKEYNYYRIRAEHHVVWLRCLPHENVLQKAKDALEKKKIYLKDKYIIQDLKRN